MYKNTKTKQIKKTSYNGFNKNTSDLMLHKTFIGIK